MMKCFYDFHIHSCLSPCGDEEMTPCNIANMAKLNGLDVIAVTDHNSAKNAAALIEAGKKCGLIVIPGMELETSEEIHIIMLFTSLENALKFSAYVEERRFKIKNREDIYGRQIMMDADDNVVGTEENLLVTATDIGLYETVALAKQYGAVALPAHIDKPSNGIIAILGGISEDMGFSSLEVSRLAPNALVDEFQSKGYRILKDSDAHYLENINETNENFLLVESVTIEEIFKKLKNK